MVWIPFLVSLSIGAIPQNAIARTEVCCNTGSRWAGYVSILKFLDLDSGVQIWQGFMDRNRDLHLALAGFCCETTRDSDCQQRRDLRGTAMLILLYLNPNSSVASIFTHTRLHTFALVHMHTNVLVRLKTHLWAGSWTHHAVAHMRECSHDDTHTPAQFDWALFSDKPYSSKLNSGIVALSKKD